MKWFSNPSSHITMLSVRLNCLFYMFLRSELDLKEFRAFSRSLCTFVRAILEDHHLSSLFFFSYYGANYLILRGSRPDVFTRLASTRNRCFYKNFRVGEMANRPSVAPWTICSSDLFSMLLVIECSSGPFTWFICFNCDIYAIFKMIICISGFVITKR